MRKLAPPALTLVILGLLVWTGFKQPQGAAVEAGSFRESKALAAVAAVSDRSARFKVLALTDFPSGPAYEIKQINGPGYFVVKPDGSRIDYAVFDQVRARRGATALGYRQARQIARLWAEKRGLFSGFTFQRGQANFAWPKPGYYTAVWTGASGKSREFAKVTVDLADGEVVGFGVGDPKWSMFCLPAKKKQPIPR